ncbi:MAG: NADAR family protein [Myxococcota bacterium]
MKPKAMLADLKDREARGEPMTFLHFWGHTPNRPSTMGPWVLSQWFSSPFTVDDDEYATAEHFMMAEKARLFEDATMREAILSTDDPGKAKAFGRKVRNFQDTVWNAERFDVVVRGNVAKFEQNPELRDFLMATGRRVLVEASPRDRIWGIGMGASNPDAGHPSAWRGKNLLGFALMVVRSNLDRSVSRLSPIE